MFARLMAAIRRALARHSPAGETEPPADIDLDALEEIEFRSLGPAAAAGQGHLLLCPVTRQELRTTDRLYRCRACQTCYSEAGWVFLRDVDSSRCCACGASKTVAPLGAQRD